MILIELTRAIITPIHNMGMDQFTHLAQVLASWDQDQPAQEAQAVEALYRELRRIAQCLMRGESPEHTLQATALANELILRLNQGNGIEFTSREHFFAVCSRMMRQILIDHARSRRALKRGAPSARLPLTAEIVSRQVNCDVLLEITEALEALRHLDPRQADIVELRVFGGLSQQEIAGLLGVTSRTVDRDWKMAKHFLARHWNPSEI